MWQAEPSAVPNMANYESDLGYILVVQLGTAGQRAKDRTGHKATAFVLSLFRRWGQRQV